MTNEQIEQMKENYTNLEGRVRKIESGNIDASLTKAWEEIEAIKDRHRQEEIPFGAEPEHSVEINGVTITGTAAEIEEKFPDAIDEALAESVGDGSHEDPTATALRRRRRSATRLPGAPMRPTDQAPPLGSYAAQLEDHTNQLRALVKLLVDADEYEIVVEWARGSVAERESLQGSVAGLQKESDGYFTALQDERKRMENVAAAVKELRLAYATGGLHLIKAKAKALFDLFREEG